MLFCDVALAEDPPAAQTSSVLPPQKTEDAPLYLHADQIEGIANQQVKAKGHVELQRNDGVLTSDYLQYTFDTDQAYATGDVTLEQPGLNVRGPGTASAPDRSSGADAAAGIQSERSDHAYPGHRIDSQGARRGASAGF